MLTRLKLWAAGVGAVITLLAASWFGGRKAAQADAIVRELEARLDAVKEAEEVRDEVEALDHDTLRKRAAVWVRPAKR